MTPTPESNEFKIICPFCNAPYTAEMLTEFEYSTGYESWGENWESTSSYIEDVIGSVEIKCSNCGRVVYKKEGIKAKQE
jgi:uncharacterized Zn-finger protein